VIEKDGSRRHSVERFEENMSKTKNNSFHYISGDLKTMKKDNSLVISGLQYH